MKLGKTEAETIALNGWKVGDILQGDEGFGPDRILIVAVGEECFICKWLNRETGEFGNESGNTTLRCREWRKVGFRAGQAARESEGGDWLIQMRGDYLTTRGVWERPDHRGYTNDIAEAGRYTEEEAKKSERMMPNKRKAVRLPFGSRQSESEGGEAVSLRHTLQRVDPLSFNNFDDLLKEMRSHGIAVIPQPDKWIRCSERLPTYEDADCFGNVWVSDKAFREPKFAQAMEPWDQVEKVSDYTHWMPTGLTRPAPPEQGAE